MPTPVEESVSWFDDRVMKRQEEKHQPDALRSYFIISTERIEEILKTKNARYLTLKLQRFIIRGTRASGHHSLPLSMYFLRLGA
jgi:hypothetical protein